jgi:hypothetical protein
MATTKVQIQYVLIPHPDDEFSAWSLIQRAADNYPVFILLTRGERTAYCDLHGLQAQLGERPPQGATCPERRLDAWHTFLDGMAALDDQLDVPGSVGPVGGCDLRVGDATARAVFDLGDGVLTPDRVTAALQEVRSLRFSHFPLQNEYGAIGAAYWNREYAGAVTYQHPDHRAVHVALWSVDQGLRGPQWGRTARTDPDAAFRGRTNLVDPDIYEAAMGVDPPPIDPAGNPGARRVGLFQRCYGWLVDGYWAGGELDASAIFSRSQTFWARF